MMMTMKMMDNNKILMMMKMNRSKNQIQRRKLRIDIVISRYEICLIKF